MINKGVITIKNTTIGIRINETEKQKLETIAKERDIPLSQLIREFIRKELKENDN